MPPLVAWDHVSPTATGVSGPKNEPTIGLFASIPIIRRRPPPLKMEQVSLEISLIKVIVTDEKILSTLLDTPVFKIVAKWLSMPVPVQQHGPEAEPNQGHSQENACGKHYKRHGVFW